MQDLARPFPPIYVVWHPSFEDSATIAEAMHEHFRRKLYENTVRGTGLSVIFRSVAIARRAAPPVIGLRDAETAFVVVLTESDLVSAQGPEAMRKHYYPVEKWPSLQ
jgi:hypothetical protein